MRRKNTTSDMMKGYMAEALLMLMEKKDYADISISEIAAKAGVNRSTFYRNFNSKNEIIKYYFKQIIYKHYFSVSSEPTSIPNYLLEMFTHYYGYKKELLLMHRANVTHIILEALDEAFSAIHTDTTVESHYATRYHTGGIYNVFLLWFEGGMKETPAEITKITCSYYPSNLRPYMWLK
ncbi:TetR/AcrR family transcriptional regulator [Aminipila luticellarii]|uniref:TetR/AcrR family transcriptional regulator n=1 Tax=Aminipila luticellarii TaxID=2507160 RepID=A0A410PUD0_9FIRM|nr:TetR/AcrR family transcriptional regulator [Aminipila luticellarii]QAT42476.1 TetR/AcrR family transcriptional regulator [Aminipila luticellarii]